MMSYASYMTSIQQLLGTEYLILPVLTMYARVNRQVNQRTLLWGS